MTKLNDQSAAVTRADVGLGWAFAVPLTDEGVHLALGELIGEVLELLKRLAGQVLRPQVIADQMMGVMASDRIGGPWVDGPLTIAAKLPLRTRITG